MRDDGETRVRRCVYWTAWPWGWSALPSRDSEVVRTCGDPRCHEVAHLELRPAPPARRRKEDRGV